MVRYGVFGAIYNNCYLLIDDKTNQSALIDCSEYNEKMQELIGDTELKYILLTHGHFDHIGGVNSVKKKYAAKVVISKEDEPMLTSGALSLSGINPDIKADIIVNDGDVITLGDTEIEVISTPGHTRGSVCYKAGKELFTGDTLFCLSCGRTDFPGGSVPDMITSLKRLAALDGDYNVYPGHEELTTLDYERKNNPCIR
ncbi:MAG: MBL fold metallo-hydrolase [Eubacterium sp.]|nr:MBL fold metallo-hydrolase [Eubacterium sp.]